MVRDWPPFYTPPGKFSIGRGPRHSIAKVGGGAGMGYDLGITFPADGGLFTQFSSFDNAAWSKADCTIGADAIAAPDATITADAVIPDNGAGKSSAVYRVTGITTATVYTISVYAKIGALGPAYLYFRVEDDVVKEAWFNLSTGVKGSSSGSPTAYDMTSVGSGWYRCYVTWTSTGVNVIPQFQPETVDAMNGTVTGDGVTPCYYLWAARLVTGTSP